ncbi:MAG: iron-containing alcohol dehydrogenase [Bacteroidales bacterium]|nr:iron-containing alcohol dehydrogenase [Bacteroidales bacterium]
MENFVAYNPTRLHFGKGVVEDLGKAASKLGKRALLVYGKGSVLRNGSYHDTVKQLEKSGIEIIEFSGIKPNPVVDDVDAAADLGREKQVDLIVGVGGGSAIDSAKLIAVCIAENCSSWDIQKGRQKIQNALPIIAVLTLAATGTEMNAVAVVQNNHAMEKFGFGHRAMFPKHSFLDPVYTCTVPREQTAYGIVDTIAHALEAYFGEGDASLSDRFVEAIIMEAMEFGPRLMENLEDYDLRARIMWAATNALNGLTSSGRANGDWASHALGHQLSLLYDTAHAATLAISFPAWMKHMTPRVGHRIEKLGIRIFGDPSVDKTIGGLEGFFRRLGCPVRLQDIGLDDSNKEEILTLMNKNQSKGKNPENFLNEGDRAAIVDFMLSE